MKYLKCAFCCILAVIMMQSSLVYAKEPSENPYMDISSDKWYYEDVVKAYELGIMNGVPYMRFEPELPMTREMFVTALERMTEVSCRYSDSLPFDDIKSEKRWYSNAILWAYDMDIVRGVDKNTFGLGQYVTRQQIAAFIYRYLNNRFILISVPQAENPVPEFTDTPSKYAIEAVNALRLCGILKGVGNDRFAPHAAVTRAEAAAILCRLYEAVQNASYRFNLDPDRYVKIEVVAQVADENGKIPKVKAITDKADIVRAVEYINKIEFTSSFALEPATGWICLVKFYDSSHSLDIFSISKTNDSGIKHNDRFYVTDKFKPFWDFIDG